MAKWRTAWRNAPETAWLAECPVHPQQQVLKRLDAAYRRFFDKAAGLPKFKRYGNEPGLRFPDTKQFELDQMNGRIKLPKIGWLRLRLGQTVVGEVRNVAIGREGTKWFASVETKIPETIGVFEVKPSLGIDLGLSAFAATSSGELIAPLAALQMQQRKLRHAHRSVSRKKNGSANRRKATERLGVIHRRACPGNYAVRRGGCQQPQHAALFAGSICTSRLNLNMPLFAF